MTPLLRRSAEIKPVVLSAVTIIYEHKDKNYEDAWDFYLKATQAGGFKARIVLGSKCLNGELLQDLEMTKK
ncbi:hypothetical protein BGZ95_009689 [Linnemannia exigua]|uniref:Uncharacterized protein n=1 Tax=Linnemannia exigua TaxID=604196 RepID=A0AAD4DCE4_9FUNG|nr:hypothetical protein BGZ95_009689 [Linnemannia exigua]